MLFWPLELAWMMAARTSCAPVGGRGQWIERREQPAILERLQPRPGLVPGPTGMAQSRRVVLNVDLQREHGDSFAAGAALGGASMAVWEPPQGLVLT